MSEYCKNCYKLAEENEQLKKQIEYDSRYNDMQAEIDYGERIITQYKNVLEKTKQYLQYIVDQWELDTKETQDKAIKLIQIISEVENE